MPKKLFILVTWLLIAIAAAAAVVRAVQEKSHTLCRGVNVTILGDNEHVFVEEQAIYKLINKIGLIRGQQIGRMHLSRMEQMLETNPWIYSAELFFDARHFLQVYIVEREPVARIFTLGARSFYIDSSGLRLPLSSRLSARVPVFTGFPSDKTILSHPDSLVLQDVKKLALYINADSFWQAQTSQIDILPSREYVLVPLLGSHTVVFGNTDSLDRKFQKLYSFYKAAWTGGFFEKYERLDLRFSAQVVGIKRGSEAVEADTATAMRTLWADKLINSFQNNDSVKKVTQYSGGSRTNYDTVAFSIAPKRKPSQLTAAGTPAIRPNLLPAKGLGLQSAAAASPDNASKRIPEKVPSSGGRKPVNKHN